MKISKETRVGLLAIIAIAVLIIGYSYLKGNDVFSDDNTYYSYYERVDGLTVSKPVLVNGYQIGRVSQLELLEDGRIKAEFKVNSKHNIPSNTIAKISSTDLLGGKAIVFQYGNSTTYAPDGSELEAENLKDFFDQVEPIQKKASDIAAVLDSVLTSVNLTLNDDFRKDFDRSMHSIANSLESLEGITGQLNNLMVQEKGRISDILKNAESITANLQANNDQITSLLQNLNQISDQVAKANFANTIESANTAMADLQQIVNKIENGEGTIGLLLKDEELYNNLKSASENLDNLLIDMKSRPGRYIHFSVFGKKRDD